MEQEEIKEDEVKTTMQESWDLLTAKGLTLGEKLKVRNAFDKWGKQFDDNIEHDHKHKCYTSKLVPNYGFNREEETKFFNALYTFSKVDAEKVIQVMGIVTKLLDIDSEWKFRSK